MVEVTLAQVTRYLITYGPKLYTLLHKQKDRLAALEVKVDQLFLREIQSAFAIIDSIATLESAAMRDRHLYQAEGMLLKNIGLDKQMEFSGEPGSFWCRNLTLACRSSRICGRNTTTQVSIYCGHFKLIHVRHARILPPSSSLSLLLRIALKSWNGSRESWLKCLIMTDSVASWRRSGRGSISRVPV